MATVKSGCCKPKVPKVKPKHVSPKKGNAKTITDKARSAKLSKEATAKATKAAKAAAKGGCNCTKGTTKK